MNARFHTSIQTIRLNLKVVSYLYQNKRQSRRILSNSNPRVRIQHPWRHVFPPRSFFGVIKTPINFTPHSPQATVLSLLYRKDFFISMADKQQIIDWRHLQVSGKTAILASIAGVIIGGPLIGLMGISFLATMTLLLVTSPLFILFSPVLFGAACVFALVMLGFAVAAAMAVAGVSSVGWVLPSFTGRRAGQLYTGGGVSDELIIESGGGLEKERGDQDWAGYIQQKPYHPQENILINRS